VHAKLQTIHSIFKCCLCVCMWWQEVRGVRGVCKCGGFDQGPVPAWTTCSAANIPPFLSDSRPSWCIHLSACDWLFSQRLQHERTTSLLRMVNSWLSCSCCIRHSESQEWGPRYVVQCMCSHNVAIFLVISPENFKVASFWIAGL